ncbi:MAG: sulfatase-like hydrolase/transferase [Thermoguttaceae bacterium]
MNAICLVIDRLQSGYLGAYGNSWIETPAADRLAAESFLFDQAMVDTPQLELLYRSYWQGWPALASRQADGRPTLPGLLREAGVATALLSDQREVREHPLAVDFDELIEVDPPWQPQMAADGAFHETHLARCFVQITDRLRAARRPFFLWCHLGSLGATWDAPREFRNRYRIEGDPEPSRSAEVPDRFLPVDHDPDEVLAFARAYAGQVSLLDACLGGLWEAIEEHPASKETLLVVTSPRGFPLGEHRRLGPCDEALYGELVQVPLWIRFPGGLGAAARSQALVEPCDLWATLLDCWRIADIPASPTGTSLMPVVREDLPQVRDRVVLTGPGAQRAIRTPAWYLRVARAPAEGRVPTEVVCPELYVKPDDRWEVNNVTVRCLDVVECLQDALIQYDQAVQSGRTSDLPPLSDVLLRGLG